MPDIHLDIEFFNHRKTVRLVGLLGRGSEVLPVRLWCYIAKHHADSGSLTGYSARSVEKVIAWWGKEGACVAALEETGFLDRIENGWKIHDWSEHARHLAAFRARGLKGAAARWGFAEKLSNAVSNAVSMNGSKSTVSDAPENASSIDPPPSVPPRSPSPTPRSSSSSKDDSEERRAREGLAEKVKAVFGGRIPTNYGGRASVTLSAEIVEVPGSERRKDTPPNERKRAKERRRRPPPDWTTVEALDPLDRVILAWKLVSETDLEDRGWDELHYSRATAAAADLLRYFKDYGLAGWCIAWVWQDIAVRGKKTCTLETVVKHSDRYKTSADYRQKVNEGGR